MDLFWLGAFAGLLLALGKVAFEQDWMKTSLFSFLLGISLLVSILVYFLIFDPVEGVPMTFWPALVTALAAFSAIALFFYIRRASKAGDCVLVAHGLILLTGLVLAGLGVVALKIFGA